MRSSKKIRWAINGLGLQGERMAEAINQSNNGIVAAVCGSDNRRISHITNKFHVPYFFDSYNKLLKHNNLFDALCITSATHQHKKEIILAAKANIPILCEKPIAPTHYDGIAIKKSVEKNHIPFRVGFQLRFHPLIQKAREIVTLKKIGEIVFIDAHWSIGTIGKTTLPPLSNHMQWREDLKKSGGGAIAARGSHLFDIVEFITGQTIVEIRGAYTNHRRTTTDSLTSTIVLLKKGAAASITTSRKIPLSKNHITLYGSDGCILLDNVFLPISSGTLTLQDGKHSKIFQTKKINLYQQEVEDFAKCITSNYCSLGGSLEDGIRNIAILETCFKASSRKQKISI